METIKFKENTGIKWSRKETCSYSRVLMIVWYCCVSTEWNYCIL